MVCHFLRSPRVSGMNSWVISHDDKVEAFKSVNKIGVRQFLQEEYKKHKMNKKKIVMSHRSSRRIRKGARYSSSK